MYSGKCLKKASYLRIMRDYKIVLTWLSVFSVLSIFTLMGPTYALYIEESLNVRSSDSGYIMGVGSFVYAFFCPIIG